RARHALRRVRRLRPLRRRGPGERRRRPHVPGPRPGDDPRRRGELDGGRCRPAPLRRGSDRRARPPGARRRALLRLMARVAFERVEKVSPGGVRALAAATLAVADGELVVVVGPSGCGKSTLLRLVAGLETATAGTIHIDDRVVNELRPQERNVAMVFQDYALYPHLSARGNLEFPLRM